MVKEIKKGNKNYYMCEECGFYYIDKSMAKKCQRWCKEHKSCNLEITSHAVKLGG